jgi:hypothetical protein
MFCTLHTVPAVRQVVFADVQITIRQRVAIGVILAVTGKKMFYFKQKSEKPLKNSKTCRGPC